MRPMLSLAVLALACACAATAPRAVVDADPARREQLFAPLRALEGRWRGTDPSGAEKVWEYRATSNGSAVREVMFPGDDHEMTNMYSLDGNSVVMVHYCAMGNQPKMRATRLEDGRLAFASEGVQDLQEPDGVYMGEMTLELVDDDHVRQHWKAFRGDALDHETTFALERIR